DRFTATTTGMTPSGTELRVDVLEWSDDGARAAVVDALTDESEAAAELRALPTVGYVWVSGSGVGYAIKYAHRMTAEDGRERVTFVTDRRLGACGFEPWSVDTRQDDEALEYSVVELYLDSAGQGAGSLSLAAEVIVDPESQTVTL